MVQNKIQIKDDAALSYLKQEDVKQMGTDEVKQEDLVMPRLKIVQTGTKDNFGVEIGNFIHSITGKNYGKIIEVVPFLHWKSNIQFEEAVLKCRSLDGKVSVEGQSCSQCGAYLFKEDGTHPTCARTFDYMVAEKGELAEALEQKLAINPLVMFFGGASTKVGKSLNTSIKLNSSRKFPIYSQYFTLTIPDAPKDFKVGSAFIPEVKGGQYVSQDEYAYLQAAFNEMSKLQHEINVTEMEEEAQASDKDNV